MQTSSVTLRSPIPADSEQYFKWINDKELVLCNANYRPISKEEHDTWFDALSNKPNTITFSIDENHKNTLIGSCSLRNIDPHHHHAELQIRIGETAYQSRGFGSDAVRLLVQYGFSHLQLNRIYLHVFCSNTRAIRAYEKCHFQSEGVLRQAAYVNGRYVDVNLMAILQEKRLYRSCRGLF